MVKKTIILLVLYFLQFYLTSLRGKEYFAKEPEPELEPEPEPGVFGPLEPGAGAARKNIPGAGAAWEKKWGAGAAKKFAGSPALKLTIG